MAKKRNITVTANLFEKPWMNQEEAILYLGFGSKATLQKMRDENVIPFSKNGNSIVYRRVDLDRLLESNMIMPHSH